MINLFRNIDFEKICDFVENNYNVNVSRKGAGLTIDKTIKVGHTKVVIPNYALSLQGKFITTPTIVNLYNDGRVQIGNGPDRLDKRLVQFFIENSAFMTDEAVIRALKENNDEVHFLQTSALIAERGEVDEYYDSVLSNTTGSSLQR